MLNNLKNMIVGLNNYGNCTTNFKGTGTGACEIARLGDLQAVSLWEKGLSFSKIPTLVEWKKAIADGMIYPITEVFQWTQDTPETETNTSDTGLISKVRTSKVQMSFSVEKGFCAHKKLWDKMQGRWDLALHFDVGIVICTSVNEDTLKAFDMNYYDVATYLLQNGGDKEKTTVSVQLRDPEEFNARMTLLTWTQLGFDANKIDGAIETILEAEPKAGTEITVKALGFCNTSVSIDDLDEPTNWKVNGVAPTAVSLDVSSGAYRIEFTNVLVAGAQVVVALDAEDALGKIYKGRLVAEVKA